MEERTYLVKKCSISEQIPDDYPEIKNVHKFNVVQAENGVLVGLQRLTWNWSRMKRMMALLILRLRISGSKELQR